MSNQPNQPNQKSETSAIATAVKEAISEALPIAAAMAVRAQQEARGERTQPSTPAERCPACRQWLSACKGKHRKLVVYPADGHWGQYFQPLQINGVKYLSNGPGHYLDVPEDSNFENIIAVWEQNEKDLAHGRKAMHNSGSMSNPQPAAAAWR